MKPYILIVNIAGIFTGRTRPDWKDRFAWYLDAQGYDVMTVHRDYWAGAFAPKTHWWTNPRVARGLAQHIAEFVRLSGERPVRIHIVAHSNGTNVAVLVARLLRQLGIAVDTLIVIGSALHSDIEKNGVRDLIASGFLERAIAYCSPDDPVVRPLLQRIPGFWGALGSTGWTRDKETTGLRVDGYAPIDNGEWGRARYRFITRWFPKFGHSQWLNPPGDAETFPCVVRDMGLQIDTPAAA